MTNFNPEIVQSIYDLKQLCVNIDTNIQAPVYALTEYCVRVYNLTNSALEDSVDLCRDHLNSLKHVLVNVSEKTHQIYGGLRTNPSLEQVWASIVYNTQCLESAKARFVENSHWLSELTHERILY